MSCYIFFYWFGCYSGIWIAGYSFLFRFWVGFLALRAPKSGNAFSSNFFATMFPSNPLLTDLSFAPFANTDYCLSLMDYILLARISFTLGPLERFDIVLFAPLFDVISNLLKSSPSVCLLLRLPIISSPSYGLWIPYLSECKCFCLDKALCLVLCGRNALSNFITLWFSYCVPLFPSSDSENEESISSFYRLFLC